MKKKKLISLMLAFTMIISSLSSAMVLSAQEAEAASTATITKASTKLYWNDNGTRIYEISNCNGKAYCANYTRHNADKGTKGTVKNITKSSKDAYKKMVRLMYFYAYKKKSVYASPSTNAEKKKLLVLHYALSYLYGSKSVKNSIKSWGLWDDIKALIDSVDDKNIPSEDKDNFSVYVWTDGKDKYQPLVAYNYTPDKPKDPPSLTVEKKIMDDSTGQIDEEADVDGFEFTLTGPNDYNETRVTDEQGEATFEDLKAGTYTLTENLTEDQESEGYTAMDPNPATIKIKDTDEEVSYTAINRLGDVDHARILIKKRTANGSSVGGFKFNIHGVNSSGQTIYNEDKTTSSAGQILIDNVAPGTYTVTEKMTDAQKAIYQEPAPQTKTIESGSIGTFTYDFLNSPFERREYDRIEILLKKVDKETGGSVPIGTASLEGAVFEIKYWDNEEGDTEDDPKRTWRFQTDSEGKIFLNPDTGDIRDYYVGGDGLYSMDDDGKLLYYMPLGTYLIKEIKAPTGYVVDSKEQKIILDSNMESEDTIDVWSLVKEEKKTFNDQVKRCDVHFEKQDENGHPLVHIPFVLTNLDTGEKQYVLTDENGVYNSAYIPHSTNTNGYSSLSSYDESGEMIPQSVIDSLASSEAGTWFGMTAEGNPVPVDDELRALPYGRYSLRELLCEANKDRNLIPERIFNIRVNDDNIDLGTIIEANKEIKTTARDADSNNHTGTVAARARIIDTVQYFSLETNKQYQLETELHWAKGATGSKIDGGIVSDANGNEITATSEVFTPTQPDDTIDVTLGDFDSTKLTVGATELQGEDTVVFEYLYEIRDGEKVLITQHTDPNDAKQQISYPWIKTILTDDETGLRMGFARSRMQLTDDITYKNFKANQIYNIKGMLYDANTGMALKDADGHDIVARESFTTGITDNERRTDDGVFHLNYEFDSSRMEGKTIVSLIEISGNGTSAILHRDLEDEQQTLHIPKIRTHAYDSKTNDEVGEVVGTFKDTVTYENLLPTLYYDMKMDFRNKETGESTGVTATKRFLAPASANDNNRADGEVTVEKDLTGDYTKEELEGMTLVSFEECFVKASQVDKDGTLQPTEDKIVAEHKDIEDAAQTVYYPKIRTTGRDGKTDDHVGTVTSDGLAVDTVECWNLVPGKEYTIQGKYIDTEDNSTLSVSEPVTFTAKEAHEFHEVYFELNTLDLEAHTAVIYEKLYHNDIEVTQHEEFEEEQQRVHYPKIRTEATDSLTGDHVGTILGKLINTMRRAIGQDIADDDFAGIVDNVKYWNTIPEMEYRIFGTLMNKETGKPILGEDGKPVTAERILEADKHDADGDINLYFSVDTSKLENVTVVCFEKLYHNNAKTNEPVEVTRHEDLEDEDQSVHEVEIRTHAIDTHVASDGYTPLAGSDGLIQATDERKGLHYDWHTGDATGLTIVRDYVTLNNLVNGMTYTLKGTLHNKATGEAVLDNSGMPYSTKITFTVGKDTDDKRVDLVIPIEFSVDGKALEGMTVVAFEELYHKDVEVAVHADITDEEQSVYYPWIRTKAEDNKNGAKETQIDGMTEIKDIVYYKNLLPGTYSLEGVLMDRQSPDGYLHDAKGNKVTQTEKFTITSKDEGKAGARELVFRFDSTLLKDHIAVAFENLYLLDKNDANYKVHIATHEDLTDEQESEWIIDIATHLTDVMTGSDEGEERTEATWIDHVGYWGLKPGKEYILRGILMEKVGGTNTIGSDGLPVSTGGSAEKFLDADGDAVTAEVRFTPETSCGYVDLKFEGNTEGLAGKRVVAFERLYPSDLPETVIAKHEDINDPDQSVNIIKIETEMVDQDSDTHISNAASGRLYTDTVSYTNLTVGREYILNAVLMDQYTGKAVRRSNGAIVTGSTRFIPETRDGEVDVEFNVNTKELAGHTMVSFEKLYNAKYPSVVIAHHEDLEDPEQSIYIPKITTRAKYKKNKVIDKMVYRNLLEGEKYVAKGYLVDRETGKRIKGTSGRKTFRAEDADGYVNVTLPAPKKSKYRGRKVVAFEELYIVRGDEEILVGTHKDLKDKKQTVRLRGKRVHKGKGKPKTGDDLNIYLFAGLFAAALGEYYILRRRKKSKR